jgi:hypothetical protein
MHKKYREENEWKGPLGRPLLKSECNIKKDRKGKGIGCEDMH